MDFQLFKLSIDWARGIVLQYTPPFYTQRQIPKHKLILFLSEAENFLQKSYLFLTAEDLKWSLNEAILFVGWHPHARRLEIVSCGDTDFDLLFIFITTQITTCF